MECGKGSGESIETKLTTLLQPNTYSDQTDLSSVHNSPCKYLVISSVGKRDILKSPRSTESLFIGLYDNVILSSVKLQFLQDCTAFKVLENQQLSVLHIMFKGSALRYFTNRIKPKAVNVDQAVGEMKKHFITEARTNTYTTDWKDLSFSDFRTKEKGKSKPETLDMLNYRAQDLLSLLDTPYQSRLLLRDCIIRAVKSEHFRLL